MSWDISFMAADNPPPPVSEMPDEWSGNHAEAVADVPAKISSILPKTDWSDPKWGTLDGNSFSLEFNMGDDDPCSSFMIHARGGGEVARVIEEIAQLPGWYALDTSQGEWLHHCSSAEAGIEAFNNYRDQVISGQQEPLVELGILSKFRRWFRAR
ncbi:MAG: hypothetical protein GY789_15035 [Hyphomicrobiales bacterium]|nr:hypothetical protein [Hyphomicrobiales bacterium]MCP5002145.1 hypothetical protein [Hyphomicrobiales bacterium]